MHCPSRPSQTHGGWGPATALARKISIARASVLASIDGICLPSSAAAPPMADSDHDEGAGRGGDDVSDIALPLARMAGAGDGDDGEGAWDGYGGDRGDGFDIALEPVGSGRWTDESVHSLHATM